MFVRCDIEQPLRIDKQQRTEKNKKQCYSFGQLHLPLHGKKGNVKRDKFEKGYEVFKLGFLIQQARLERGLTQEELAKKCGTNKGYIYKIENNIKEVRISTLQKIVERGLGGHLELSIRL